mmetsp:Transcript_33127/g.77523  ORF Transcript_33127/g.77523 Transcript_33127/m.77523 type:complete len:236 (-) Transcript_33127:1364-2071(-)
MQPLKLLPLPIIPLSMGNLPPPLRPPTDHPSSNHSPPALSFQNAFPGPPFPWKLMWLPQGPSLPPWPPIGNSVKSAATGEGPAASPQPLNMPFAGKTEADSAVIADMGATPAKPPSSRRPPLRPPRSILPLPLQQKPLPGAGAISYDLLRSAGSGFQASSQDSMAMTIGVKVVEPSAAIVFSTFALKHTHPGLTSFASSAGTRVSFPKTVFKSAESTSPVSSSGSEMPLYQPFSA